MPDSIILQKNSVGILMKFLITDSDGIVDLSSATGITVYFEMPNKDVYSVAGSLYTDGTDGYVKYLTTSSDLTLEGRWRVQVSFTISGVSTYTRKNNFIVSANLTDHTI